MNENCIVRGNIFLCRAYITNGYMEGSWVMLVKNNTVRLHNVKYGDVIEVATVKEAYKLLDSFVRTSFGEIRAETLAG